MKLRTHTLQVVRPQPAAQPIHWGLPSHCDTPVVDVYQTVPAAPAE